MHASQVFLKLKLWDNWSTTSTGAPAQIIQLVGDAGVTKVVSQSLAGFLLQKELDYLDGAVKEPKRPFAAIVGGSKVSLLALWAMSFGNIDLAVCSGIELLM